MAHGCIKSIDSSKPYAIGDDMIGAHDELVARRKFNLILLSPCSLSPRPISGDYFEVLVRLKTKKGEKWLSPRDITKIDYDADVPTAPGRAGRSINAAFKEARTASA